MRAAQSSGPGATISATFMAIPQFNPGTVRLVVALALFKRSVAVGRE